MREFDIKSVTIKPLSVDLTDHFRISKGTVKKVNNLLITITLHDGTRGYGEIAPFEELAGEGRDTCIERFNSLNGYLDGKSVLNIRKHSHYLLEALPKSPAVRCGLEMAMLDVLTRKAEIPLWAYWGGLKTESLISDITIPMLSHERSLQLASTWYEKGFRTLKIKVGSNYQSEIKVIREISSKYKDLEFIIDANQGFEENEALEFVRELSGSGCRIILYEQPVNRYDLDAMARITSLVDIPVAADESVFSRDDLIRVIKKNAANVINLKIMKTGIFQALDIASTAQSFGLDLMIGGMVETRLAMGCSASIASGFCSVKYIDLDTPLLMKSDPFLGGYSYCGSEIRSWDSPGLGMEPI